jgi:plastocyanin
MKRYIPLCILVVLLLLVCGCSQSQQATPVTVATPASVSTQTEPGTVTVITTKTSTVSDNTIVIENMQYNPATLTVTAGSIVRWRNKDDVVHTVSFPKEYKIDASGPLSPGQSFSVKFNNAGTFSYYCAIHPSMQGTIIVT